MKPALLISACLLGVNCRYDGKSNVLSSEIIEDLKENFKLIPACPEQLGGLSTPRLPAEIQKNTKVLRQDGLDVSGEFLKGASEALAIAQTFNCELALLKANSPSCGNQKVYDGSFERKLVEGQGITVKLFEKFKIKVYNENQIENLIRENTYV
jgi:uncharacterized protein YbbK (DUF523 family)